MALQSGQLHTIRKIDRAAEDIYLQLGQLQIHSPCFLASAGSDCSGKLFHISKRIQCTVCTLLLLDR